MPLPPLTTALSNGQKMEVLKRYRHLYAEELAKVEAEVQNLLTAQAEADYMASFIGEQIIPEQPAISANPPVGSSSQKVPVRRY